MWALSPPELELLWSPLLDELIECDWDIVWCTLPLPFIPPPCLWWWMLLLLRVYLLPLSSWFPLWLLMVTVAELLASLDCRQCTCTPLVSIVWSCNRVWLSYVLVGIAACFYSATRTATGTFDLYVCGSVCSSCIGLGVPVITHNPVVPSVWSRDLIWLCFGLMYITTSSCTAGATAANMYICSIGSYIRLCIAAGWNLSIASTVGSTNRIWQTTEGLTNSLLRFRLLPISRTLSKKTVWVTRIAWTR